MQNWFKWAAVFWNMKHLRSTTRKCKNYSSLFCRKLYWLLLLEWRVNLTRHCNSHFVFSLCMGMVLIALTGDSFQRTEISPKKFLRRKWIFCQKNQNTYVESSSSTTCSKLCTSSQVQESSSSITNSKLCSFPQVQKKVDESLPSPERHQVQMYHTQNLVHTLFFCCAWISRGSFGLSFLSGSSVG